MTRLKRIAGRLRLWPSKHERQADIHAAVQEKIRSQYNAKEAKTLEANINRVAKENHFAELIARQLIAAGWKRGP